MTSHSHGGLGPAFPTIGPAWNQFRETHAAWLGHLPQINPLYCLTEPVIARLEHTHIGRPPLLDRRAAEAERALNHLCRRSNAVGFLDGLPIVYRFFSPPPPPPSEADMVALGWTPAVRGEIPQLAKRAADAAVRLKGYAGWLLTEPDFLRDCRSMAERWNALPDQDRPRFPLRRGSFHSNLPEEYRTTASDAGLAFETAFFDFCDRWGLAGMASWDLPDPQGAFFPDLLSPNAPALPQQGLHLFLPIHYPLTGDDDLLARILQEQRSLARQAGLPRSAAGLPHYRAYATILEVLHWERVITDRVGPARRPRGFVGLIKEAIAEALHITDHQVDKWRKAISTCRRGRRDSVTALKIKT
jgi:hypothetical protein